jgi:hypothetical protein
MRNATADVVGPSNLPLFGPRGKHRGYEDMLVITLGLRRLPAAPTTLRVKDAG